MQKAIFFDRDGIVNIRIVGEYITKPEDFTFWDDFLSLFQKLKEQEYFIVLVTNQQGIGKGKLSESQLSELHQYMQDELIKHTGFKFDDIYYCPFLAKENHPNRKPNPGMLLDAAKEHNIDLTNSWFIGDSPSDAIAGKRAHCKTILIGKEQIAPPEADYQYTNLSEIDINSL